MGILHGSWIASGGFFIWGEVYRLWRPQLRSQAKTSQTSQTSQAGQEIPSHPYAMTEGELTNFLAEKGLLALKQTKTSLRSQRVTEQSPVSVAEPWQSRITKLPSHKSGRSFLPILSSQSNNPEINLETTSVEKSWNIEGLSLSLSSALELLRVMPLGRMESEDSYDDYLGDDLRFWGQVYHWARDLMSREKFIPGVLSPQENCAQQAQEQEENLVISWLPLLDSALDQARLTQFTQAMPLVCCQYQTSPQAPSQILLDFLSRAIDRQVRQAITDLPQPRLPSPLKEWFQGLDNSPNKGLKSHISQPLDSSAARRLKTLWENWIAPLQTSLVTSSNYWQERQEQGNLFRVCLVLTPPPKDQESGEQRSGSEAELSRTELWRLEYQLQAIDQPDFLIPAATIWQHPLERLVQNQRIVVAPRETLLRGLGVAARLYSPIAQSLELPCPEFCELNPIEVYQFIKAGAWQLQDHGLGVILPPSLRPGTEEKKLGLKITALEPSPGQRLGMQTLLNYRWELAIGEVTISAQEFQQILEMRSPLVEVNGTWIALQPGEMRSAQQILTNPPKQTLSVEDLLRLGTGETQVMEKLPVVSFEAQGVLEELLTNLGKNEAIAPLDPPDTFQGNLRPYQARGLAWLVFLERWGLGACLADDMGLGKTIQTIAFLLHLKATVENHQPGVKLKPILLICPTSVLGNWEREVQKFAPSLKVALHYGDKRPKGKNFVNAASELDLIITSYPLLVRDWKSLHAVSWQVLILDEAQNVKNPDTKQSKAVRELNAEFRIALTGTPVENRLGELWSILDFLNPGYLGSKQFFQRRFAIPIEKFGDRASLEVLRSLVRPLILRRLKTDKAVIQDLPEKMEMTIFCGLVPEQAALYQKLVDESLQEIDDLTGIKRSARVLTLLMRLKQVCNHPSQYLKESSFDAVTKDGRNPVSEKQSVSGVELSRTEDNAVQFWQERSGKVKRLEEMLEELITEGDRLRYGCRNHALIFTQFAELGSLLQGYLQRRFRQEIFFFHGGTKKGDRELMVDRFQHDPNAPRVMILSLKAGGTGLNLTRANHVFHFDRWWNPAVENQATDRAFRIGQTRNVQVHKFVCRGTLEEKINDLIASKKQLAEQTVDVGENWLTELDTDQLRNLLLLDRSAIIELDN